MAYNKEEILKKAKKLIQDHKLLFITDVITLLGMSSSTFYVHFPSASPEYAEIFELIEKQRVEIKVSMRSKWYKSNNATLQMGLMKLISTPEERAALSHQSIETTNEHKGEIKIIRQVKQ